MATFKRVDFDPFAEGDSFETPVEGDPFQQQDLGAAQEVTGGQFGAGGYPTSADQSEAIKGLVRQSTGVDKEKGVDDFAFRAGWSRTDTDPERAAYLNEEVGTGLWSIDKSGTYIIEPAGLQKLGIVSEFARPIDEAGFTVEDLADFAGDAPAILGSIGGSITATGMGLPAGLLISGAGAAAGKAVDEAIEYFQGKNLQTGAEVAQDIGVAALEGAGGEAVFRGASAIGRKVLAPFAASSTPERLALAKEASDLGVVITPSQINNNALLARFRGLMDSVLGNDIAITNAKAFDKEIVRLGAIGGDRSGTGKALAKNVISARQSLRDWASSAYAKIDELTGGKPFVPTRMYKVEIKNQMDTLIDETGNVIPRFAEEHAALAKSLEIPDFVTVNQMQKFSDSIDVASNPLTGTLDDHTAGLYRKALDASYDDAANFEGNDIAKAVLASTRTEYGIRITQFDDALLAKIVKDPKEALTLDPEKVTEVIFRPKQPDAVRRVMKFADKSTKLKLQGLAMDKLMESYKRAGDDPFEMVYDGKRLKNILTNFGDETLKEMFGKENAAALHKLADVTRLAGVGSSSGLVAANIALHPARNLGILLKLNVLNSLMRKPSWVRWMTIGMKLPKTRAGAAALTRATAFTAAIAENERAEYELRLDRSQGGNE